MMSMHTIEVIYASTTRQLSLPNGADKYGGATIDSDSVEIVVRGIDASEYSENLTVRVDFAVQVKSESPSRNTYTRPFIVLDKDTSGSEVVWRKEIPVEILAATHEYKKLPFQVVLRDGNMVINSRNTITLETTRAINATGAVAELYTPYVMYRNDSWAWESNFTYKIGAVVSYRGSLYISAIDNNLGNNPGEVQSPRAWIEVTGGGGGGGGSVTIVLNGVETDDPEFYAPLDSGAPYQQLISQGEYQSPLWVSINRTFEVEIDASGIARDAISLTDIIDPYPGDMAFPKVEFFDSRGNQVMLAYTWNYGSGGQSEPTNLTVFSNIPGTYYIRTTLMLSDNVTSEGA